MAPTECWQLSSVLPPSGTTEWPSPLLAPPAPDRPLSKQVDHGAWVALAPNRQADATLRALDELVQVAPVTHVPSESLDEQGSSLT